MGVFMKDAPRKPDRKGQGEHVVTVTGGPVRHRHPHAMTGHQSADTNQPERCQRRDQGEAMQQGRVRMRVHALGVKSETAAGLRPAAVQRGRNYLTSSVKSAVAPESFTSISLSNPVGEALRCIADTVYLPGGTSLMVNLPSLPVTA
jgi:hypothetical protein